MVLENAPLDLVAHAVTTQLLDLFFIMKKNYPKQKIKVKTLMKNLGSHKGKLSSFNKKTITIHSYLDGEIDYSKNEEIQLLEFDVSDLSLIEDYANLAYYVTK